MTTISASWPTTRERIRAALQKLWQPYRSVPLLGWLLAALVADTAREELRGTAFGMFNLVTGVALLVASIVAGSLWNWIGAEATFAAGAVFAAVCLGGLGMVKAR